MATIAPISTIASVSAAIASMTIASISRLGNGISFGLSISRSLAIMTSMATIAPISTIASVSAAIASMTIASISGLGNGISFGLSISRSLTIMASMATIASAVSATIAASIAISSISIS